jgi:hypothetical protein
MSEKQSQPIEIAWAAVSWTQFLVSITVIDKADMKLVPLFVNTAHITALDPHPFGGFALLLNVISLVLFTFPLMGWFTWDKQDNALRKYRSHVRKVAVGGVCVWLLSFFALLCYLNPILAIVAIAAFIVGIIWIATIARHKNDV